jgi:hypothetical protein
MLTIAPDRQEMRLLTAVEPANWERLAPDLPQSTRIVRLAPYWLLAAG